jgi:signal transduction histidine kinase
MHFVAMLAFHADTDVLRHAFDHPFPRGGDRRNQCRLLRHRSPERIAGSPRSQWHLHGTWQVSRYFISVRTELAAHLPQVMGDRVQLQQVMMNLITRGAMFHVILPTTVEA